MDIKRITSALLGFPLVVIILVLGNKYVVDITFAIVAAMSLHEYFNAFKQKANPVIWMGYLASALIAFIHIFPLEHAITIVSILIPIAIALLFLQVILTNMKTNIKDIAITFFGICYIPLCSICLSLLITYIFNTFFSIQFSYGYAILISIVLSIVGQIGDFAASSIKRYVGIKDFSNLIPGHGGMLDRIDSVIFIAPFAYMLLRLL